jgi:modulator of FtsH protease HflK
MAWHESGGNSGGKRNNPWGSNKPEQGPPDLDEVLRNLQRRLAALFGGAGARGGLGAPGQPRGLSAGMILLVLVAIWALTGFYQVDAAERGIVFRFGKQVDLTEPGPRWHLPWPIESKLVVNVEKFDSFNEQTRMLTSDENLVEINLEVQWRRALPLDYAFNVMNPEETLKEVGESAIREVVGRSKLDEVLESGRQEIARLTQELIQRTLDAYKAGVEITKVNLQDVKVPEQVSPAQADAIKAREDRESYSLKAQAYANDIIPRARGAAAAQVADAKAYRSRKIADAEGEAQRFTQLLQEYKRAPGVTRERLYLETIEEIMARSKKVVIDAPGNGNLLYLPVDKLIEQARPRASTSTEAMVVERPAAVSSSETDDARTRGSR